MADYRFSTFNGGSQPTTPAYTNKIYLTADRSPQYGGGVGVGGGASLTLTSQQSDASMAPDDSYPEFSGGLQYTQEYRTQTRTVETNRTPAQAYASLDLSSPFSLGGGGGSGLGVDVAGYGGGGVTFVGSGYQPPKSPGTASSSSRRLVAQSEQLQSQNQPSRYEQQQQHQVFTTTTTIETGQAEDPDDYANLPPHRLASVASGPLSPQYQQRQQTTFSNGFAARLGGGGGGSRLGSASNLSAPRSPQYVNGAGGEISVGGVGGYNYGYRVTMETNTKTMRSGGAPERPSRHASQASGLEWTGRQSESELQQQQQYVNYREISEDAPDVGGFGGAGLTLSRSDKFGSLGSLSGGANLRVAGGGGGIGGGGGVGVNTSLTLSSQGGGAAAGGGGGGGYGLSVHGIELQESTVQQSRQQMQRTIQETRTRKVETVDSGGGEFRDPSMADLIEYLRSDNDTTVLNATAFIQHVTFADNDAKAEFYRLQGLPRLVALLQAVVGGRGGGGASGFDLLRNLLGIVRNITFKSNEGESTLKQPQRDLIAERNLNRSLEELKLELCRLGILNLLRDVINSSRDEESREIASAAVWNVSSTPELKSQVIEVCAETIVRTVLLPHSGLELRGDVFASVHQPMHATFLFYLASGVLRSVCSITSSAGMPLRNRLRNLFALPDSVVWPLLSAQATQVDVNTPGLENCLCILRNLVYACQEIADPHYLKRQEDAARAAAAGGGKKSPFACCGGKSDKPPPQQQQQQQQQKNPPPQAAAGKSAAAAPIIQRRMPNPIFGADRLWYPAEMAPLLHYLLNVCQRPHMLEAAAGAVQNLAACSWQPAVDFRKQFRALGGHALMCQLVAQVQPELWGCVVTLATAYRNVLQDSEIGQVTVQQVQLLASILPPNPNAKSPQREFARRPAEHQAAVIAALFAALRREPKTVAEELFRCGAVASLVYISHYPNNSTPKVVSFANALLAFLASTGDGNGYKNRLKSDFNWTGPRKPNQPPPASPAAGVKTAPAGASGKAGAATAGNGGATGGAGISITVSGTDRGHENVAYQPTTLEMRQSYPEPTYAQINRADRGYAYNAGTATMTTTTTSTVQRQEQRHVHHQEIQQQQQQQQVSDSWV